MDIRILRYFLAVAREENITRAAESLHIAQPSLSKQLIELEQELGKKLLIRGKRRVTLTEDGIRLRKRAEEIVSLLEKTEHEISADSEIISGEVAIGGGLSRTILETAAAVRKKYTDVRFHFYNGDATDVTERLNHGSLDFAVLIEAPDSSKYEYLQLPDISGWGVLMKRDNMLAEKEFVSKEDLQELPLILHKRSGVQRKIAAWAQTVPEQLHIAATYNVLYGSPISYVRNGIGNLLVLDHHIMETEDGEVCFRPLKPPLEVQHVLVWKRHQMLGKAAEAFLEMVQKSS